MSKYPETWSPLMIAAADGDLASATSELAAGADVNACDPDGWTALHIAIFNKRAEVVSALLATEEIDVNVLNNWKSTPLILAASVGNLEILQFLLAHPETSINARAEYYGRTALIEAAIKNHSDVVLALIDRGADVNCVDKSGKNTALIEALKYGNKEIAGDLLDRGVIDFRNRDLRLGALIWAGSLGDEDLLNRLDAAIKANLEPPEVSPRGGVSN